MKNIKKLFFVTIIVVFLTSCKTYYIPLDSFKQQFSGIDSTNLKLVEMRGGGSIYVRETYLSNPIEKIKCIDKKGNSHELQNSPAIEIRFTYSRNNKNKRVVFYFDRVYVTDKTVTGMKSRYMPNLTKTIPIDSIKKIEVQNGGKNFHYVKQ